MPGFESICGDLCLRETEARVLGEHWEISELPHAVHEDAFLDETSVACACRYLKMSEDVATALLLHRPAIAENPALKRLAWHLYWRLFHGKGHERIPTESWPMLPEAFGAAGRLFYVYVLLAGLPYIRASHRTRGISEEVTVDTLSDLELWIRAYRDLHGAWGFDKVFWLDGHFSGRIFKLGRLQFEMRRWRRTLRAFRNQRNGRVVVVPGAEEVFRRDGEYEGTNGIFDREFAWTSAFFLDANLTWAHPVSVDGHALDTRIELPHGQWACILQAGEPTLGVHIPATGPMEPEACQTSFAWAARFFPKHFPEHHYRAFECDSWLLDNQLPLFLPDNSNIVRFQRMFYLLPSSTASDLQTLERVFDNRFTSLEEAPQETSLQRSVVAHMKAGQRWHTALGVLFPEDIEKGAAYYRRAAVGTPWEAVQ